MTDAIAPRGVRHSVQIPKLHRRHMLDCAFALLSAICGALMALVPFLLNHRAYYHDDMQTQYMPAFVAIGHALWHGEWPSLTLQILRGGALLGEYQFALFNPVSLASYMLIAKFRDLETAAACLAILYYAILGSGTFALARACGTNHRFAVLAAISFVSNNFLFYWLASSWFPGVVGTVWLVWAAAFAILANSGRTSWVLAAAMSFMVFTSGWPQAVIIFCFLISVIATVQYFRIGARAAAAPFFAALVGMSMSLPAILPLLAMGETASRSIDTFDRGLLQQNFYNVLAVSSPLQLGTYITFGGVSAEVQTPIFFAAWFLLPFAPLLNWKKLRNDSNLYIVLAVALVLAMATQGPEQIYSLRWPFRYLPYFHLALLLGFAVAATEVGFVVTRNRVVASAGIAVVGLITSIQVQPAMFFAASALSLTLFPLFLLTVLLLTERWVSAAEAWAVGVMVAGVALLFLVTHAALPQNRNIPDWKASPNITQISDLALIPPHYTLFVGDLTRPYKPTAFSPKFGNMNLVDNTPNFLGYSPLGYKPLDSAFCFDQHGTVCPNSTKQFFAHSDFEGREWADLFKIDRVVFLRATDSLPALNASIGWNCEKRGSGAECDRIGNRQQFSGSISYLSPGIVARARPDASASREVINIQSRRGRSDLMLFDRIPWPGYHATYRGQAIPVTATDTGLMTIRLPDGAQGGDLILSYTPPGQMISCIAALAGALGLLIGVFKWAYLFQRPAIKKAANTFATIDGVTGPDFSIQ